MSESACVSCSAPVANPSVTGVLCAECHASEAEVDRSSSFLKSPASFGVVAIVVPFFVHLEVNGLDYVRAGAGAVALLAALGTLVIAAKAHDMVRAKIFLTGLLVLAGGVFHLYTSGLF